MSADYTALQVKHAIEINMAALDKLYGRKYDAAEYSKIKSRWRGIPVV
jgi:hypothetical protein